MKINFNRVIMSGFQSILKAEIDLNSRGIVIIKGINNYERLATSNGSGKSSCAEAIYFALYGKTSSGITDPTNRNAGVGCHVVLEFSVDNIDYKIVRAIKDKEYGTGVKVYKSGDELTLRNKSDTNNFIVNDILRCTSDIFLSTIFLNQGFSSRISSLAPSGRKERIETLTDTNESVETFRLKVQKVKDDYNNKIETINSDISYKTGERDTLLSKNVKLQQKIDEIKASKPTVTIEEINKQYDEISGQNELLKSKVDSFTRVVSDFNVSLAKLESEYNTRFSECNRLSNEKKSLSETKVCPTCGRPLDKQDSEEHIKTRITEIDSRISELQSEMQLFINKRDDMISKRDKQTQASLKISSQIKDNETRLGQLSAQKYEISKYRSTESEEQEIIENNQRCSELVAEISTLQESKDKLSNLADVANHCTTLITRQFRNYLLNNTIEFMNSRLSGYSKMLFSNESDTIKLVADGNKLDIYLGEALYDTLSGGERRKLDIALVLVQRDLALNIAGLSCNMLVVDEIFDYLDTGAIETVTKLLTTATDNIDSMFVISHKDTDIGYDSVIEVVKGPDRISNVYGGS